VRAIRPSISLRNVSFKCVSWRLAAAGAAAVACLAGAGLALASDASTTVTTAGTPVDTSFGGMASPYGIAFSPDGTLLATTNLSTGLGAHLGMMQVGSGGSLTPIGGGTGLGSVEPNTVAFNPSGDLIAVGGWGTSNGDGSVQMFTVNSSGTTGTVSGSPFATGNAAGSQTTSVAFSPNGKFLATADDGDDTITVFSVASDGVLTQVTGSPFGTGSGASDGPYSIAFSPSGDLLAVSFEDGSAVGVYSVSSAGALTQVGSPISTGTGSQPFNLAFSPMGNWLAVGDNSGGGVAIFTVGASGSLTEAPGSPFAVDGYSSYLAFSPDGGLLVTDGPTIGSSPGTSSIEVYSVASNGELTAVSGSPFTAGGVSGSDPVAFSPGGDLIAAAVTSDTDSEVSVYTVSPPAVPGPPSTTTTTTTTTTTSPPTTTSTPTTATTPTTTTPGNTVAGPPAPTPPFGGTPAPPGAVLPDALVKVPPPVAEASAKLASGASATAYQLSSAGSKAAAHHRLISYTWKLAGRIIGHTADPVYKFPRPNESYSVHLTVVENGGESGSAAVTVHPTEAKQPHTHTHTHTHTQTIISTTTATLTLSSDTLFAWNSFTLTAAAKSALSKARAVIVKSPAVKISGYCDNTGDNDPVSEGNTYNDWLSKMRALAVADFLYNDHVAKTVVVNGYGRTDFVATNATAAGRAENRRVVIGYETVTRRTVTSR
jgi:outer membrane protein OmpA-like peptidoglycan-associated protein/WD40 repeat protein